jgi:phage replication-related protein YjqB (UPF0714/DUF867 family)
VDTYSCFQELAKRQRAGQDFRILVKDRHSAVTILAPHGGKIEPRTSQIARAIANGNFNLYCFEGKKKTCNFEILHITSHHFDEPKCISLLSRSKVVIAIHGRRGKDKAIVISGRYTDLRNILTQELQKAHFKVNIGSVSLAADDKNNICNRGKTRKGVQLEFPKTLRCDDNFKHLATIIRAGVNSLLADNHRLKLTE